MTISIHAQEGFLQEILDTATILRESVKVVGERFAVTLDKQVERFHRPHLKLTHEILVCHFIEHLAPGQPGAGVCVLLDVTSGLGAIGHGVQGLVDGEVQVFV